MRLSAFALFVVALVVTLWTRTSWAFPEGMDSGGLTLGDPTRAAGCSASSCHGTGALGTEPAPGTPQVRVNGGALVNLTGTPTFVIPPTGASTFEVHFAALQTPFSPCGITGGCPGGGFLVFHNDASTANANGVLNASSAGTQNCDPPTGCVGIGIVNREVTHTAPLAGPAVTFTFTYTPPGTGGCTKVGSTYPLRLWLNGVNGDGSCQTPDRAVAYDFSVMPSCNDSNDCTSDACGAGTCSHVAVSCPGADSCNNASVCLTAGGCQPRVPKSAATGCDDGNACSGTGASPDHCNGAGTCSGGGAVTCQAGDACFNAATCLAVGGCQPRVAKVPTTGCDDSNACTGTGASPDHCNGTGLCSGGAAVSCAVPDACHNAVACVPASGCPTLPPKGDGTPCGAASSCVGSVFHPHQACSTGVCSSPATITCNGTCDPTTGCGGCTADTNCLANNYCDNTGTCVPYKTTGVACNTASGTSGGHCKVAGCHECTTNNCVDGFCCDTACGAGSAIDCVSCSIAGSQGKCSALAVGAGCNADNNACTQSDACDNTGKCVAGQAVTCRAPKACEAAGVCNMSNGTCSFALLANGSTCAKATCNADGVTLIQAATCSGSADCPPQQPLSCYPNPCVGPAGSAACGTSCTIDANCAVGAFCTAGKCTDRKADGAACTASNECRGKNCVDGICCNDACSGQCQACDVPGKLGQCVAVSGPPHGKRTACSTDGSACVGTCDGLNATGCAYPDNTVICRNESCNAPTNTGTIKATCNGAGSCPAVQTTSCAPFVCGATRCNGDCQDSDSQCSEGHYCAAGVCKTKLKNGDVCGTPNQCTSGYCVDGVCCDGDCKGQCRACDVQGSGGKCITVSDSPPHGGRLRCEGAGPCQGTCDGTSPTGCALPADGQLCASPSCGDGIATLAATCDGKGACLLAEKKECMPFACGVTGCRTACANAHDDCAKGFDCIAGQCTTVDTDGGTDDGGGAIDAGVGADASVSSDAAASKPSDASVGPAGGDDAAGNVTPTAADEGSCGCRTPGSGRGTGATWLILVGAALWRARRERRRHAST